MTRGSGNAAGVRRLAALALALLGACATGDRMLRISPLSGESSGSSERVNLWPLAYHDGDATSVLWPLFDVDSDGFALRPLVTHDRSTWSVLWPWSSYDTASGEGWAFPWYRIADNAGVFPVANFGETSWVGLWWWSGGSYGLLPIATFSERLSYVGPAWWTQDGWGLFPLFAKGFLGLDQIGPWIWEPGGDTHALLPLYFRGAGGDELAILPFYVRQRTDVSRSTYWLMGLVRDHEEGEKRQSWVLPLWFSSREPGEADRLLFPLWYRRERGDEERVFTLLGDSREAPEGSSLNVYPLWWSSRTDEGAWRMLLPLFYWSREGDARTLLTPLGGRGWSADGGTRFVNVLGPLWHRSRAADGSESRTAFLWPLFERHREGDATTTRALPLFTHRATPDESETWFALGLGHAHRGPEGSSWRLFPLASATDEPERPDWLYRFDLYARRERDDWRRSHLFPLYDVYRSPRKSHTRLLLGLAGTESEGGGSATWAWPLFSWAQGMDTPGLSELALFGRSRHARGSSLTLATPLVFHRSRHESLSGSTHDLTRLLTFFTSERERREPGWIPRNDEPGRDWIARDEKGFLLGIFSTERSRERIWPAGLLDDEEAAVLHRWNRAYDEIDFLSEGRQAERTREVLAAHGAPVPAEVPDERLGERVREFAAAHVVPVEHREVSFPLLWSYERTNEDVEWNGPLWLVHHARDAESRRSSFLWYGYRSETKGERTTRDFFPFITWDSAPDETTLSFFWRLLRYERRGDRRGGYFLFIPLGNV